MLFQVAWYKRMLKNLIDEWEVCIRDFCYFVISPHYILEANIDFILHYIYLVTIVTLQIQIINLFYLHSDKKIIMIIR